MSDDRNISVADVQTLSTRDGVASFFAALGYGTDTRPPQPTPAQPKLRTQDAADGYGRLSGPRLTGPDVASFADHQVGWRRPFRNRSDTSQWVPGVVSCHPAPPA